MIDLALFLIVSVIALAFSVLVFVFKDILHAAIALSGVFLMNSLFFIVLSQPLLAVVQLFIMVGGITTFLFIGVAAAPYSDFKYTKLLALCILWIITALVMIVPLAEVSSATGGESNVFGAGAISESLGSSAGIYYLMLLVMFGVSLGAILLLKKAGADK